MERTTNKRLRKRTKIKSSIHYLTNSAAEVNHINTKHKYFWNILGPYEVQNGYRGFHLLPSVRSQIFSVFLLHFWSFEFLVPSLLVPKPSLIIIWMSHIQFSYWKESPTANGWWNNFLKYIHNIGIFGPWMKICSSPWVKFVSIFLQFLV